MVEADKKIESASLYHEYNSESQILIKNVE
jgi:hypothetical protein